MPIHLKTLLGDHPSTLALKRSEVTSPHVALDIADIPQAYVAFKRVVRDLEFDVAELAIVTYLMARAHGKPYTLLPVVVLSRFQHPFLVYNAAGAIVWTAVDIRPRLPTVRLPVRKDRATVFPGLLG